MYPMIEIKTVPIEIQVKTKNASLEYTRGTAEMEISRSDSGVDIKSRPIKLQLDSFQARAQAQSAAHEHAAYEATSTYEQQGQIMLSARLGQSMVSQFTPGSISPQLQENGEAAADILPGTGAEVEWEDGRMEIRYEMDKLNFDWKIDQGEFKFTPGDIEISVAQRPSMTIRYTGGPIYVPRSSDPNYKPVNVEA